MPDQIGATGVTVKTAAEITSDLVTGLQSIYGADIQTDQNSSDGQEIGILVQQGVDIRELIVQTNNNFDPDQASGALLDQRVTLNLIQRQGGTYTSQPMDIVVNETVNLEGLDADFNNPNGTGYTVQDGNGNQFILTDSQTLTAGTHAGIAFRAKAIGAVNVPIDTITIPVTIIPGVVSVNNSSAATSVGQTQETDPQLRVRRQSSTSIASQGYLNGLEGVLANIVGVTAAKVYENVYDAPDANGIPGHGIWAIVNGGANLDIAKVIYVKKDPGANMKGGVTVNITTISGSLFVVKFDRPTPENLYIQFTIKTTVAGYNFDQTAIKKYIATNLTYGVGAFAETSGVTDVAQAAIASQGGGGVPVLVQISNDGVSWTDFLDTSALNAQWTLDPSRISITVV
jgi:uncharacterized phage protein gp47/JayE